MKTVGATESLETKTAVSQLQEASNVGFSGELEESEQANLELDNLRNELADSMDDKSRKLKDEERKPNYSKEFLIWRLRF